MTRAIRQCWPEKEAVAISSTAMFTARAPATWMIHSGSALVTLRGSIMLGMAVVHMSGHDF